MSDILQREVGRRFLPGRAGRSGDAWWLELAGAAAIIAVVMAVGSAFAAMNTMYAAVARRTIRRAGRGCWSAWMKASACS